MRNILLTLSLIVSAALLTLVALLATAHKPSSLQADKPVVVQETQAQKKSVNGDVEPVPFALARNRTDQAEFRIMDIHELAQLTETQLREYLTQLHQQLLGTEHSIYIHSATFMRQFEQAQRIDQIDNLELKTLITALSLAPKTTLDFYLALPSNDQAEEDLFFNFLMWEYPNTNQVISQALNEGVLVSPMGWILLGETGGYENIADGLRQSMVTGLAQGDSSMYFYLTQAHWTADIGAHEWVSLFMAADPGDLSFDIDIVMRVLALDLPETYAQLAAFVEFHPMRYRIYQALKRNVSIDLQPTLDRLTEKLPGMEPDQQLLAGLICAQSGRKSALQFVLQHPDTFANAGADLNVKRIALRLVNLPADTEDGLAWTLANLDRLRFNPTSQRFE